MSRDTVPAVLILRLAVMRLHGDLYESTMDATATTAQIRTKVARIGYLGACRRPGANVTGMTVLGPELGGMRLGLKAGRVVD